jgi:DNA-binding HxlR family transcriptional regulator
MGKRRNKINPLLKNGAKEILSVLNRYGALGFNEIMRLTHLHSTVLSDRLRELRIFGLVNRSVLNIDNPNERIIITYEITKDGKDVLHCLEEIDKILSKPK